jgi:hypothetical protein
MPLDLVSTPRPWTRFAAASWLLPAAAGWVEARGDELVLHLSASTEARRVVLRRECPQRDPLVALQRFELQVAEAAADTALAPEFSAWPAGKRQSADTLPANGETLAWEVDPAQRGSGGSLFHGLVIERAAGAAATTLRISGMIPHCAAPPAALLDLALRTPGPAQSLRPEQREELRLVVHNPSAEACRTQLELTVVDFAGQQWQQRLTVELAPDAQSEHPISAWDGRLGWYLAQPVAIDGKQRHALRSLSWVCLKPAGIDPADRDGFRFGVCTGTFKQRQPAMTRALVAAFAQAGIGCLRSDIRWEDVQPQPGDFDATALDWVDQAIELAAAEGIEFQAILSYNVRWAADPALRHEQQLWQKSPPDPELWERYVRTVLTQAAGRIRWWEVWNEADIVHFWRGSYEQYADLLARTHALVKEHDPRLQVLTSGFATIGEHGGKEDSELEAKVARHCQAHFDVFAHHQHGHFGEFKRLLDHGLQPILGELASDKRVWFNETAIGRGQGHRHQALTLVKKLVYARATCRAMGYTWYNACDGDLDCRAPRQWGLLADDLQPCAVYAAYNSLVRLLRGLEPVEDLARGDGRHGYRFAAGDRHLVVLWDEDAALGSQIEHFTVDAGAQVRLVDLMGNATPLRVHAQRVACDAPHALPVFLEVTGSAACRRLEPLLDLGAPAPLLPGQPAEHPVRRDPGLELSWPEAVRPLDAGHLILRAPADAPPTYGRPLDLALPWSLPAAGWQGSARLPLRIATLACGGEQPDIELASEPFVTNRFRYVPNTDHLTWQGPADLSLRAWLTRTRDRLSVRLAVTDSEHSPGALDGPLPAGDCGEVLLAANRKATPWIARMVHAADGSCTLRVLRDGQDVQDHGMRASSERTDGVTTYQLDVDLARIDCTAEPLLLNLAAWDRDGEHRRGWIQLAPQDRGWTTTSVPQLFHPVVFAEAEA